MNKKMQSKGIKLSDLRAGVDLPYWVSKNGDIITTDHGITGYILAVGETEGVIWAKGSDDKLYTFADNSISNTIHQILSIANRRRRRCG